MGNDLASLLRMFGQSGSPLGPQTLGGAAQQGMPPVDYSLMSGGGAAGVGGQGMTGASGGLGLQAPGFDILGQSRGGAGSGLGFNIPTAQLGLQGLGTLTGLYTGLKSLGMAKDQFNFQKEIANTNLNNSMSTFNNSLEDRLRTRAQFNQDSPESAREAFERQKLTR